MFETEEENPEENPEEEPDGGYSTELDINCIVLKSGGTLYRKPKTPNGFMRNAMGSIHGITMTDLISNVRMVVPWSSIDYILENTEG